MPLQIMNDFKILLKNIDKIIDSSGYKLDYIQKQLGLTRITFYRKRKEGTFTMKEAEQIFKIIGEERVQELANRILT